MLDCKPEKEIKQENHYEKLFNTHRPGSRTRFSCMRRVTPTPKFLLVIGGNAQSGETYVNFDSLLSGQSSSYATGALTVSFTGNASTVAGNGPFGATDPYLSGNNNEFFEASTPAGYDATTYLQAGDNRIGANGAPDNGSIIFSFSVPQTYLGLLLGSIDANNTLTFYAGQNGTGGVVDIAGQSSITGSYLNSLNSSINIGDYTDANGTAYVNIDSSAPFESVVATTGTTTFEIDNVAYNNNGVPDSGDDDCSSRRARWPVCRRSAGSWFARVSVTPKRRLTGGLVRGCRSVRAIGSDVYAAF